VPVSRPGAACLVLDTRPEAEARPVRHRRDPGSRVRLRAWWPGWRRTRWPPPADRSLDVVASAPVAAARRVGVAVDVVASAPDAPADASDDARGVTVFFTGLSGSGKSTIANALRVRLLEDGRRTVTLLDGDLVRTHLSSELGFSREHRNINVRRIAFVAAEITRHGGVAICAPIAPYGSPRGAASSRRRGLPAGLCRDADRRLRGARSEGPLSAGPGGHAAGVHRRLRSLRRPGRCRRHDRHEPGDGGAGGRSLMGALEARGLLSEERLPRA
jgi:hypothetical protein